MSEPVSVSPVRSHRFRVLDPRQPSQEFQGRCALTVMAKAPVPGKVKTRLSPPLSAAEAAALNSEFLRDTLASLGDATRMCAADCVVSYTPVGQEIAFHGILPDTTLLVPQRGDGFGERLLTTATDLLLCGYSAVCVIDSDSPTVPSSEYVRAVRSLLGSAVEASPQAGDGVKPRTKHGDVREHIVLGRSEDGGYYLLGLTRPHARVFEDITWSTELVADQTEQRAAEAGLAVVHLATWYDVDDAFSLARLRDEFARVPGVPTGYAAPHTRGFLTTLAPQPRQTLQTMQPAEQA